MNDEALLKTSFLYEELKNNKLYRQKEGESFNKIIKKTIFYKTDIDRTGPKDIVVLKESGIHGKGVFAARDIKKGELLTFYPAHYVAKDISGEVIEPGEQVKGRGLKYDPNIKKSYSTPLNNYYIICGDPRIHNNPAFIGHMCNDGQKHDLLEYNAEAKMEYKNNVWKVCNAAIEKRPIESIYIHDSTEIQRYRPDLAMFIMAIKDIKKGDEILIPYGFHYWLSANKREKEDGTVYLYAVKKDAKNFAITSGDVI